MNATKQVQLMEELYEAVGSHWQTFDQALTVLVDWDIIEPDIASEFIGTASQGRGASK